MTQTKTSISIKSNDLKWIVHLRELYTNKLLILPFSVDIEISNNKVDPLKYVGYLDITEVKHISKGQAKQVINRVSWLVNVQKQGDKMTGYLNLSPIYINISRFLVQDLEHFHKSITPPTATEYSLSEQTPADLWIQSKIVSENNQTKSRKIIDLCRVKLLQLNLRLINININVVDSDIKLFFLDHYNSPQIVFKLPLCGHLKSSRSFSEFQGNIHQLSFH